MAGVAAGLLLPGDGIPALGRVRDDIFVTADRPSQEFDFDNKSASDAQQCTMRAVCSRSLSAFFSAGRGLPGPQWTDRTTLTMNLSLIWMLAGQGDQR